MSREKRYVKLKPKKQVKELITKTPIVILETPKTTKEKISKVKGKTRAVNQQTSSKEMDLNPNCKGEGQNNDLGRKYKLEG